MCTNSDTKSYITGRTILSRHYNTTTLIVLIVLCIFSKYGDGKSLGDHDTVIIAGQVQELKDLPSHRRTIDISKGSKEYSVQKERNLQSGNSSFTYEQKNEHEYQLDLTWADPILNSMNCITPTNTKGYCSTFRGCVPSFFDQNGDLQAPALTELVSFSIGFCSNGTFAVELRRQKQYSTVAERVICCPGEPPNRSSLEESDYNNNGDSGSTTQSENSNIHQVEPVVGANGKFTAVNGVPIEEVQTTTPVSTPTRKERPSLVDSNFILTTPKIVTEEAILSSKPLLLNNKENHEDTTSTYEPFLPVEDEGPTTLKFPILAEKTKEEVTEKEEPVTFAISIRATNSPIVDASENSQTKFPTRPPPIQAQDDSNIPTILIPFGPSVSSYEKSKEDEHEDSVDDSKEGYPLLNEVAYEVSSNVHQPVSPTKKNENKIFSFEIVKPFKDKSSESSEELAAKNQDDSAEHFGSGIYSNPPKSPSKYKVKPGQGVIYETYYYGSSEERRKEEIANLANKNHDDEATGSLEETQHYIPSHVDTTLATTTEDDLPSPITVTSGNIAINTQSTTPHSLIPEQLNDEIDIEENQVPEEALADPQEDDYTTESSIVFTTPRFHSDSTTLPTTDRREWSEETDRMPTTTETSITNTETSIFTSVTTAKSSATENLLPFIPTIHSPFTTTSNSNSDNSYTTTTDTTTSNLLPTTNSDSSSISKFPQHENVNATSILPEFVFTESPLTTTEKSNYQILNSCKVQEYHRSLTSSHHRHYPWLATIVGGSRPFSSGSLISEQHILTSAHFLQNITVADVYHMRVHIGYRTTESGLTEGPYAVRRVQKVIRHRGFSFEKLYNDIAILILDRPIHYNSDIYPICLSNGSIPYEKENYEAYETGWVDDPRMRLVANNQHYIDPIIQKYFSFGYKNVTWSLREASNRIRTNSECKANYEFLEKTGISITSSMICASAEESACKFRGNSGAPLFIPNGSEGHQQVGIVSWGISCGHFPSVYTRLSAYLPWIDKVIYQTT